MQSIQRYKIDTLIALARMTEDVERKNRYLDEAEALLFDYAEVSEDPNAFALGAETASADAFIKTLHSDAVIGRTVRSVYEEYRDFCNAKGQPSATIHGFGKRMILCGYYSQTRKHPDGFSAKTYVGKYSKNNQCTE